MQGPESDDTIATELTDSSVRSPEDEPFFVVGIGASAGGLEAL